MFDPARLRLLREFAHRGTMIAVAEALGLTSSAVSQQLAVLAREARVPLFERVGRRLRLSAEGARLAGHAETILQTMEQARLDLAAAGTEPRGALRIACFATFAKARLLPAMTRLRKRHPMLQAIVCEHETDAAIDAVRSGACHVAIVFSYNLVPRPDLPGLATLPLLEEPVLLALPRTRQRARNPLALKHLANEDWIVGSSGTDDHHLAERACSIAGFTPRITHTVDDYDLLLRMVSAGFGVGFVPELGLRFPSAKSIAVCQPGGVALSRRIHAVVRRPFVATAATKALLAELEHASDR